MDSKEKLIRIINDVLINNKLNTIAELVPENKLREDLIIETINEVMEKTKV